VNGQPVYALDLLPGDVIHREPHRAGPRTVNCRELDVQIEARHVRGALVIIDWREPDGYLGAQDSVTGVTVYDLASLVQVIGHAA
jgi:hypothetical protein